MKTLTKKQRNKIYKKALEIICNLPDPKRGLVSDYYLCNIFKRIVNDNRIVDLIEFMCFSPYDETHRMLGQSWFSYTMYGHNDFYENLRNGIKFRKYVLLFCIEMTK